MLKRLLLCVELLMLIVPVQAQDARIKIDIDRTIGEIDPMIYGNFSEHMGRCIYGGIYEENSPLSDSRGFRTDVLKAVKGLNVPILRYPGGNFVSNYHWLDGVGPKDQRVPRMELAWGWNESNRFGTNEFIEYCREIGTEPYLAVNLGTGTWDEARAWVEYCNVKEGPYYAELRKQHGYPEPHNVKYWSLGNEMDGPWQMGHRSADDYGAFALEAGKLMRRTSRDIKLIAAGSSNYNPDADPNAWNRTILQYMKDQADYIALHIYIGNRDDNYYNFLSRPLLVEERTKIVEGMIDEVTLGANRGGRPPIKIAWDEWNVWYRSRGGGQRALEEQYNLEDALAVATFLNVFVRNAHVVKMANMAQIVNVIAPIFTSKTDMYRQPIYFPLALFANNVFGTALDVHVDCGTYTATPPGVQFNHRSAIPMNREIPWLDVSAALQDGQVVINVVNRHQTESIATDIICQEGQFNGTFTVSEVNGPDVKAQNTFGKEVVTTQQKPDITGGGGVIRYTFPPHSFTQITGRIQ